MIVYAIYFESTQRPCSENDASVTGVNLQRLNSSAGLSLRMDIKTIAEVCLNGGGVVMGQGKLKLPYPAKGWNHVHAYTQPLLPSWSSYNMYSSAL